MRKLTKCDYDHETGGLVIEGITPKEFNDSVAEWNHWEAKADEKFGIKPTMEKARWVAEQKEKSCKQNH